jgi:ketosteroid isomerase-like protein
VNELFGGNAFVESRRFQKGNREMKNKSRELMTLILLVIGIALCFQIAETAYTKTIFETENQADADALAAQKAAENFVQAFNDLDWERFEKCWADDATVFNPFVEVARRISGKPEIMAFFRNRFDSLKKPDSKPPYLKIQPKDLQIRMLKGAALVTFHLGGETGLGRRTLILEKQGNNWLIIHLHASSFTFQK